MNSDYKICSKCILDTNDDPGLEFNESGICSYCLSYDKTANKNNLNLKEHNDEKLEHIIERIKREGINNEYDCILGVSGGVDSTYVAYKAKEFGLRPLVIHYDNGWNSELAVMNIENTVKKLDLDLYTYVNNWNEFKDIQLSFFKASVVDIELITDQAILAIVHKTARKYNIKYILSGSNIATEEILPSHWHHWKIDVLNILSIHKQFGKIKIKTYPILGFWEHIYSTRILKIKNINILNYLNYSKDEAKEIIIRDLDWRDYGGKHYESIFTRFYQSYILPKKFKIDKRKAHLSTLICSGQISRESALIELQKPIYDPDKLQDDYEYVLKKLNLTEEEFQKLMELPIKKHLEYPSYITKHYKYQSWLSKIVRPIKKLI